MRAHFAHGQHDHTAGGLNVILGQSRNFATFDLRRDPCTQSGGAGRISKIRERAGDFVQIPRPAQISECCQQRNPAFGPAQLAGNHVIGGRETGAEFGLNGTVGILQGSGQPRGLFVDQLPQIRTAACGPVNKRRQFRR